MKYNVYLNVIFIFKHKNIVSNMYNWQESERNSHKKYVFWIKTGSQKMWLENVNVIFDFWFLILIP